MVTNSISTGFAGKEERGFSHESGNLPELKAFFRRER